MGDNLFMQTASWLVSRELTEAAGPWDARLLSDDDGEYFCRVLLASDGVKFTPEAKAYYRGPGLAFRGLSYIGRSSRKLDAHWLSMKLHIGYLRSMEDSERVRAACLRYLQTSLIYFYPDKPDIVEQAEQMARDLGGAIGAPALVLEIFLDENGFWLACGQEWSTCAFEIQVVGRTTLGQGAVPSRKQAAKDEVFKHEWSTE